MTKLIDSLCGVNRLKGRNRIQDSYNDVSPEKVAKVKEFIKEEADRPEDALYVVMDYLYEAPVAIDTDRDILDVESKGYYWPNEDAYRSSIVKVNEPGVAMTSLWGSGDPRDLWFIPLPVAEICEIDDPKVTPGYYYLDGETNTIERIGETNEDLDKWVASLDTDETIEARKREFERREQFERDKRRMSAETSRENVEDSLKGDKEKRSKVLAELKELRKSVSDDKIVEALAFYMSNDDVVKFVDMVRKFYGIKPTVSDSSDDEYRQFDRFNDLREEVSDKEIVDVLPSYMGGFEINKFVDRVRAFYGLDQNPDEEIEDSSSGKTPSFDDVRRILSDEEVVKELKDWITSEDFSTISSVAGSKDAGSLLDAAKKVLAPDTLKSFVREMDESHGISITGGSHFEGEDRLNHLREKAEALKKEVDKLEADPNSDSDKLAAKKAMYLDAKNLYEKVKKSGSKVSDAAYNPKFDKLRRVLSDKTIVEELSYYMSSDELEEFTETLIRNFDIDLEEVEDSSSSRC